MKKIIITLLLMAPLLTFSQNYGNSTKLYGEFYFNMPVSDAVKVFRKGKKKYQNIVLSQGLEFWMINKPLISSFIPFKNRRNLSSVKLYKTKIFSHEVTQNKLRELDEYFRDKGYTFVSRQDNWDTPVFYDETQFGSLYQSPNGDSILEIGVREECLAGSTCKPHIFLEIRDYNFFMKNFGKKDIEDNSDF